MGLFYCMVAAPDRRGKKRHGALGAVGRETI
jgi:hypothetical protein